jgi:hypothetical protein
MKQPGNLTPEVAPRRVFQELARVDANAAPLHVTGAGDDGGDDMRRKNRKSRDIVIYVQPCLDDKENIDPVLSLSFGLMKMNVKR